MALLFPTYRFPHGDLCSGAFGPHGVRGQSTQQHNTHAQQDSKDKLYFRTPPTNQPATTETMSTPRTVWRRRGEESSSEDDFDLTPPTRKAAANKNYVEPSSSEEDEIPPRRDSNDDDNDNENDNDDATASLHAQLAFDDDDDEGVADSHLDSDEEDNSRRKRGRAASSENGKSVPVTLAIGSRLAQMVENGGELYKDYVIRQTAAPNRFTMSQMHT